MDDTIAAAAVAVVVAAVAVALATLVAAVAVVPGFGVGVEGTAAVCGLPELDTDTSGVTDPELVVEDATGRTSDGDDATDTLGAAVVAVGAALVTGAGAGCSRQDTKTRTMAIDETPARSSDHDRTLHALDDGGMLPISHRLPSGASSPSSPVVSSIACHVCMSRIAYVPIVMPR